MSLKKDNFVFKHVFGDKVVIFWRHSFFGDIFTTFFGDKVVLFPWGFGKLLPCKFQNKLENCALQLNINYKYVTQIVLLTRNVVTQLQIW